MRLRIQAMTVEDLKASCGGSFRSRNRQLTHEVVRRVAINDQGYQDLQCD